MSGEILQSEQYEQQPVEAMATPTRRRVRHALGTIDQNLPNNFAVHLSEDEEARHMKIRLCLN